MKDHSLHCAACQFDYPSRRNWQVVAGSASARHQANYKQACEQAEQQQQHLHAGKATARTLNAIDAGTHDELR